MKHLKYASETLAKAPEKYLKTIPNIRNIKIKHLQHMCETYAIDKYAYNIRLEKTNETLGTDAYNIRVQPLQYMEHPDILLQHPYETLETYI